MNRLSSRRLLILLILAVAVAAGPSCSRKTGCPAVESTQVKTKKNGQLSTKRGNSNLFPKNMRGH
ncbi:MAG: hypothetical protein H6562_07385 [Lewinellaceae bacterium]|nr:hypothetical protein [Lewinella sp.]MCB9278719.1 hypothetical protein [Lewinellaceae bacterium]